MSKVLTNVSTDASPGYPLKPQSAARAAPVLDLLREYVVKDELNRCAVTTHAG
jgi:hypothetical protein